MALAPQVVHTLANKVKMWNSHNIIAYDWKTEEGGIHFTQE